ncbi:MAG: hypothetical protein Kow0054_24350 [Deferrisoma sp.]
MGATTAHSTKATVTAADTQKVTGSYGRVEGVRESGMTNLLGGGGMDVRPQGEQGPCPRSGKRRLCSATHGYDLEKCYRPGSEVGPAPVQRRKMFGGTGGKGKKGLRQNFWRLPGRGLWAAELPQGPKPASRFRGGGRWTDDRGQRTGGSLTSDL